MTAPHHRVCRPCANGLDHVQDPSGRILISTNEFTYTGEQVNSSGLQYLRARYYDAATGRFSSRDPLPLMQRYAYVGGNPVNFADPKGLFPCGPFQSACDKLGKCVSDLMQCGEDAAKWALDYVWSDWNQAQYVQWVGYTSLVFCETVAACMGGGALVAWSWNQKITLICNDIKAGKLDVKEGSKKFLTSLVTTPPLFAASLPPGAPAVANYLLNLAIDRAYFEPIADCA